MVTESTTAPSRRTSLPISFAEFVETLVIWHEIVPTDSEAAIHATLFLAVLHKEESGPAMQSTERWRTSCKSCLETHPTAAQQAISRADKAVTIQLATEPHQRIHGTDQHQQHRVQAELHLGNATNKTEEATSKVLALRLGSSRHHVKTATTTMALLAAVLLHGNSKLLHLHRHKTMAMVVTHSKVMVKMATNSHQHLLLG